MLRVPQRNLTVLTGSRHATWSGSLGGMRRERMQRPWTREVLARYLRINVSRDGHRGGARTHKVWRYTT